MVSYMVQGRTTNALLAGGNYHTLKNSSDAQLSMVVISRPISKYVN